LIRERKKNKVDGFGVSEKRKATDWKDLCSFLLALKTAIPALDHILLTNKAL
jgi:hypothetical protein